MCDALRELFADELRESEQKGEARGEKRGEAKGEGKLAALIGKLSSLNLYDEIDRVSVDADYRQELYKQYGISVE